MDQFDAFFRRADLDGDGRISGAEAVSFFQGSNLPKNILAQVPFFFLFPPSLTFSSLDFSCVIYLRSMASMYLN